LSGASIINFFEKLFTLFGKRTIWPVCVEKKQEEYYCGVDGAIDNTIRKGSGNEEMINRTG